MSSQRTGGRRETSRIWTDLERQRQEDGEDISLPIRGHVVDPDKVKFSQSLVGRWHIVRKTSSG